MLNRSNLSMRNISRHLAAVPVVLMLALAGGCGTSPEEKAETLEAKDLYDQARSSMKAAQYDTAVKYYKRLQARFPFGPYTSQGLIELAYAHWKNHEPEEAIAVADRFIREHPTHDNVDYAYYLKGLVNFRRDLGITERLLPYERTTRDQTHARQAFLAFQELINRFPDSEYADDARQRMLHLRNNMARHELNIAQYYFGREAFVAAANRAKKVVETYDETPAAPEALVLMVKAYDRLGMKELASDARRVLEHNYPDHPFLTGEGEDEGGLLSWLWPFG